MKEDNELFDDYIQHRMTGEERQAFEQSLQADGQLRSRFEFYRTVQADMEHWQASAAGREQLVETLRSQRSSGGKVRSLKKYLLPLAAAAALVVTLMLWRLTGSSSGPGAEELYAQATAGENIGTHRGSGNGERLARAVDFITAKKFAEAAAELKPFEGSLNEAHLYLGFCQLQTGQYAEAGKHFDAIIASGNVYAVKARWFRALLLYKSGQKEACKKEMEVIAGSAAYGGYSKEARQWLQALQ